jgi:hypothetical protein
MDLSMTHLIHAHRARLPLEPAAVSPAASSRDRQITVTRPDQILLRDDFGSARRADIMQLLTLEQLRAMHLAGAVLSVTLCGEGPAFEIQIETRGGMAKLIKARKARSAPEARRFADPRKALLLLRELGISETHIDSRRWCPEDHASERVSRPDRSMHLKAAHEALSHTEWLQRKVDAARAGLENGTNKRITSDEWEAIRATKERQREAG